MFLFYWQTVKETESLYNRLRSVNTLENCKVAYLNFSGMYVLHPNYGDGLDPTFSVNLSKKYFAWLKSIPSVFRRKIQ